MVAQIKGFVTREEAGLVKPRSFSRNITPENGGAAPHWGGTKQHIGSHSRCIEIWWSWQNYHMKTHGWADIAYTGGFCNHGYAFAGRGLGVRTAANGTNQGNQNFHAFVWIGGIGDGPPTREAFDALDWWVNEGREQTAAGLAVIPHGYFTGSTCPGPDIEDYIPTIHNRVISPSKVDPKEMELEDFMAKLPEQMQDDMVKFFRELRNEKGPVSGHQAASFVRRHHLAVEEAAFNPNVDYEFCRKNREATTRGGGNENTVHNVAEFQRELSEISGIGGEHGRRIARWLLDHRS